MRQWLEANEGEIWKVNGSCKPLTSTEILILSVRGITCPDAVKMTGVDLYDRINELHGKLSTNLEDITETEAPVSTRQLTHRLATPTRMVLLVSLTWLIALTDRPPVVLCRKFCWWQADRQTDERCPTRWHVPQVAPRWRQVWRGWGPPQLSQRRVLLNCSRSRWCCCW